MEEDTGIDISGTAIRLPKRGETERMNVSIPNWLIKLIDEEAKEKNKTRSLVAAYLILCGLKAHVGEFKFPANNTIAQNYTKRGKHG